jgi:exonuclease SbcC
VRVLELSLRNYRVFEEVDLELPQQVIGIFGPNGSGKSTLVESIAVALYGVGAARTKKQEIRTQGRLTDCEVRLVFEHGGQQYEVRRSLKGRGHTPGAELYGGGLLLASGVTEVDAEVQRLLHMDLSVFRASVYAEQKQLDAFSEVTAGKRKEMALRLLGIRPVDDARKTARAESRAATLSAEQLAGAVADIAGLEAQVKDAEDRAREAAGLATAAADELKAAMARAAAARTEFESADVARQRIEKLRVEIDTILQERDRRAEDREELAIRVDALHQHLSALPALEEELTLLDGADDRLRAAEHVARIAEEVARAERTLDGLAAGSDEAVAALAPAEHAWNEAREAATRTDGARDLAETSLEAALARVERAAEADPSEPCPTCGQPLGRGFSEYVRHAKSEAAEAKRVLSKAQRVAKAAITARDRAEAAWTRVRETADAAAKVADERARIVGAIDTKRAELAEAAEAFGGGTPDLPAARAEARRAQELGREVAALLAERRHEEQDVKDLEAAEKTLAGLERRLAALVGQADGLAFDPEAHAAAVATLVDAEGALENARRRDRDASDALAAAEKEGTGLAGRLLEARETEQRVDELRSDARYLERTAMLLDGFRDHLVARVGPELSREAEALFRELTNHDYDDLKIDEQTLAIRIADADTYFAVERFSGSEADLANLALRVAISTHLSRVSGADLGIMVLDEVFGSLDQERRDLLVQTMGRLSGRFHQLFVITHAEQLKDQFPVAIQVAKSGRRRSVAVLT